jgi:hypothetical protein
MACVHRGDGRPGPAAEIPPISALLTQDGWDRELGAAASPTLAELKAMSALATHERWRQGKLGNMIGGFDSLDLQEHRMSKSNIQIE